MKKIGVSFKGIIGGIILLGIGVVFLWWNEGNNVKNIKTTNEAAKVYKDVKSDKINSKNEGELIATSGKLINDEELTDNEFDITIKTPLMIRTVEIYQWDEKEEDDEGTTIYSYEKKWSDSLINSSEFHESGHVNPKEKKYENKTFYSKDVKVGAFSLTSKQINMLSTKETYNDFNEEYIKDLDLTISGKYITNSKNIEKPSIGDIRISFNYNNSNEISVLAVQKGDTFAPFTSKTGKTINKVMDGVHTGKEMLEDIKSQNKLLKWILRLVGAVICMFGFATILGPISTISNFVPILGDIVGVAVGIVSFILGLCLSLIVISIAWIRFRPVLGISLLTTAVVLIVFLIKKGKKKKENNKVVEPSKSKDEDTKEEASNTEDEEINKEEEKDNENANN